MLKGYIFDVEGTLVDSVAQNLCSLDEALRGFGFEVPKESLQLIPASMAIKLSGLSCRTLMQLSGKQSLRRKARPTKTNISMGFDRSQA